MSTFTREEIALALVRDYGVPTDKAKRAAALILDRAKHPGVRSVSAGPQADDDPWPISEARRSVPVLPSRASGKNRNRSEAEVQIDIIRALEAAGWTVYRVGQRNAKGTQDAGVSDLIAFNTANPRGVLLAFIEAKREKGGRQSDAQKGFQAAVEAIGLPNVRYVLAPSLDSIAELLNAELLT